MINLKLTLEKREMAITKGSVFFTRVFTIKIVSTFEYVMKAVILKPL
jgi:hypothetical protein